MELIKFFSGHAPPSDKAKATPVGEEIRVFMDGPEGRTPIDALINLAKNVLGYAGWQPDLE